MTTSKKIAVLLCGCGYLDGSEIRESVISLLVLNQLGAQVECFAPDDLQHEVMDTLVGQAAVNEKRNMLVESARIARGKIAPLDQLRVRDFDGMIIPGGSGVAKNLCDFASKGAAGEVRSDVAKVLRDFKEAKKPIGAICIAPALLALTFKGESLILTVGAPSEKSQEIEKLGHIHKVTTPDQCVIDPEHRIVSTPAYTYAQAELSDVYLGIKALTKQVLDF